jgi:hypothetical protein
MAKVTITIVDDGDETKIQGEVDPPMTPDRLTFTTAEVIGLYLQSNMATILKEAIEWARTPDQVEEPVVQAPKLILPDDGIQGAPV